MKRRFAVAAVMMLTIISGFRSGNTPPGKEKLPYTNVILILMDDLGYGDIACYGGVPYHNPNIDKMAAAGMRVTKYYAAQATCRASRAAILTGCYANRIGG